MSAYVIVDIKVTDPVGYEEYKKLAPPAVAACGGKYVARGGKTETLEGDWSPKRLVILEFEALLRFASTKGQIPRALWCAATCCTRTMAPIPGRKRTRSSGFAAAGAFPAP